MLEHNLILKSDELYLAGEISHDESGELARGLYLRDTRHLNRFDVRLGSRELETLSARVLGSADAAIHGANQILIIDNERILPLTISVEQRVGLSHDLTVTLRLQNDNPRAVRLPLSLTWSADFRDLFDIRGFPRLARGTLLTPVLTDSGVRLAYEGLDGLVAATVIQLDRPASITITPPADVDDGESAVMLPGLDRIVATRPRQIPGAATATFDLALDPGERWNVTVIVEPCPATGSGVSATAKLPSGRPPRPANTSTDNVLFNRFLERSRSDLLMLQTSFPEGSLPAAGIPWFVAPFGRDSLIVGLQSVHVEPFRAEGTLRVLAALQGTNDDPWRDEEPGKILHEVRYGEMARRGEIPHSPYYGSVDATPLFVLLFAETVAWSGSATLYHELLPNVRRALEWIEGPGDADGDGLVEYRSRSDDGVRIVHQGWKDSDDSLHHPDGTPVNDGPIALVEVQGYVYAAYRRVSDVARRMGDQAWADELLAKAERIRAVVEDHFWMEDEGFYAQALDREKRPVRALSSNPGHLLFCGLPAADRAERLARRLLEPDLFSGWGIRTLAAGMATYNPMSYHNGSVWPHDNSLIAAGLRRYGFMQESLTILNALFGAAASDPLFRLPELFCGFSRSEGAVRAPVPYPVSCSPQAWAAASAPLLVATILGLRLDVERNIAIVEPEPPPWLDEVTVHGMVIHGSRASLTVRRRGTGFSIVHDGPIETGG